MTSLKNCRKVFDALMGMYPQGHEIHQWLAVKTPKWQKLGAALFDVGCFLKSQRKRSPQVLDVKLLRLYCRWEEAFPGKRFNKFHGMFCTIRRFVHKFEMAGRVSEEGGEAFNGTQKGTKGDLKCMPSNSKRITKISERSQGNLKGDVLKNRLKIDEKKKGKERGPYKPRTRAAENMMILKVTGSMKEIDGEEYVYLQSGNLLLKKWIDVYEWFLGGRAPQNWLQRFDATAPRNFSIIEKLNEENTRVV